MHDMKMALNRQHTQSHLAFSVFHRAEHYCMNVALYITVCTSIQCGDITQKKIHIQQLKTFLLFYS